MADDETDIGDDAAVTALIAAVSEALRGRDPAIPEAFAAAWLAHAVPEDVLPYRPDELAALAQAAWSFLAAREPATVKLSFENPGGKGRLGDISVLEILNDDMPFLVDSVMAELAERGLDVRLVLHPVFALTRNRDGTLAELEGPHANAGTARESFIYIHVSRIEEEAQRREIVAALERVLAEIRACVQDWQPMLARLRDLVAALRANSPLLPVADVAEAIQFLEWLTADNFTLLGIRHYALSADGKALVPQDATGLGLLRPHEAGRQPRPVELTPEIRAAIAGPELLVITKSARRSRVHRRVDMDYIGVKQFDAAGAFVGEIRIIGLFTSTAYTRSTRSIPYLRRKADAVAQRAGFEPGGHSGKALANVLENYPRDELFQIDEDTLFHHALAILQLIERPRVRVLPRFDRFDRFVSVLVFVPRDRYDSDVRAAIGDHLADAYQGRVTAFHPFFPEGPLVRVHFIITRSAASSSDPERATLEDAVSAIVRSWTDGLADSLAAAYAPAKARALLERYRDAFSQGYREGWSPRVAVDDIRIIEQLSAARPLGVDFHRRRWDGDGSIGLKVWSHNRPIPLSERVPVLENMGFRVVDEQTYQISLGGPDEPDVWFHDMLLTLADGGAIDLASAKQRLEALFLTVMTGGAESDGYNALVLMGGLMWREVAMLRAVSRFLRQIRVSYSQDYMWATLVKHAGIAADVARLFHARFDPRLPASIEERNARAAEVASAIEQALQKVESLDEDRILRHFLNAITAAVRTNFYQLDGDGRPKPLISIKYASRELTGMPLPKPLYEVFVYSPRLEAVHLRFGKVARGGIRWSDRPQDFRTEILGLVKAQQVKNAVIVPVGAKGGFVPKLMPRGPREAVQQEGTETYRLFMSSLLDITDNLDAAADVVPPADVVRYDDDDPYLVVAADKGTATFSDIANAIADQHGFWLSDAFASGGSAGFDHKRMGITARGAWESVKRHFREMDVDIGATPFTVAGVGDMSGDVFGNGMLRERTIGLVAAFDHRDIFIDPAPDPERSFAERRRLFDLPRSSWQDYDRALLSPGGGVFARSLKEIALPPQAQKLLGLARDRATPPEVITAILKLPVDLIWFGGIGTYVRASAETDEAVGDRANDAIRITGAELRCKVIGEGANLGMTQRGRVEAALAGVRLNTDAIDNSAGVNTSDVEVNIKIALSLPLRDGRLTAQSRNALLAEMTDDVAALVLRNNFLQPLAISLSARRGLESLGFQQRQMQTLERRALLDRAVEFLPDDVELAERRRRSQPMTRPELAVLLAYGKLALYHDLLESDVPDDPYLGRELGRYFPPVLAERFPDGIERHRLRREIIATQLANSIINRGGPSFAVRIEDQTGAPAARMAAAFAAVRDSYNMTALNAEIDALDNRISGALQLDLYAGVQDLLRDRVVWFLRNSDLSQGLAGVVEHHRAGVAAVAAALATGLTREAAAARAARQAELKQQGVPAPTAEHIADLPWLTAATDIVAVADRAQQSIADVAATYFAAESFFRLDRIVAAARNINVSDYFDRLALDRALDAIGDAERRITAAMAGKGVPGAGAVQAWVAPRQAEVERIRLQVQEIANSGLTVSKLTVAASLLGDLVKG